MFLFVIPAFRRKDKLYSMQVAESFCQCLALNLYTEQLAAHFNSFTPHSQRPSACISAVPDYRQYGRQKKIQ